MFLTANADCVSMSESTSAKMLAGWVERAGLEPDCWPVDTEDAAKILAAGDYAVTADGLRILAERGQVPAIESWDARDIFAAQACLEARRQWILTPCAHDPKKSGMRIGLERQLLAGDEGLDSLRRSFRQYDLRLALVLLAECENREMREKMLVIVQGLLAIEGVSA